MRKEIKTLSLALFMILVMGNIAQGAQLEDINLHGWDSLTDERKQAFQRGIRDIPDEIVKLHQMMGAGVYLVDGMLYFGGEVDPNLQGVYWHESRDIDLSVSSYWTTEDISITTAHEFGHFVYFQTYAFWSEEARNQLEKDYKYWKKYVDEFTDIEEAFAVLYSMYRGAPRYYLSQDCIKMIEDAEKMCRWIYESKLEDSEFEFGPGMEVPDINELN